MTYEEKRELRLQISQLLADAGLNQFATEEDAIDFFEKHADWYIDEEEKILEEPYGFEQDIYLQNTKKWYKRKKEEDNTMNANNFMNNMFGKLAPGMCRLSMNGGIAVKTSNGYKTYNTKTGRLTNCSNFVFDIGEDFFFLIPTNRVHKGDIILVSGKPKCVVDVKDNAITVINYEDSTIDTILPERHVFMGSAYFFGRIISMFGDSFKSGKKDGMNNIFKYMMMSEMMKGNSGNSGGMGNLLPLMMMGNGGFENMFDGMFDFDSVDIDDTADDEEESEGEE